MTEYNQYQTLQNHIRVSPFLSVSIDQALTILEPQVSNTDLQIDHMIFMSDAEQCNQILKEIECSHTSR